MEFRIFLSLIITVSTALTVSSAEKQRIAVLDLKATDVSAATARSASIMLRTQLIDSGLFTVVERGQMDAILKEQGLQQTGCTDAACAVKIGKMLSANKILIGEMSQLGKTYIITCRVVDIEKGVAEFATDTVAENGDKIYSSVKDLVYKLGKRITGDVNPRNYGKAPGGFYLGYLNRFNYKRVYMDNYYSWETKATVNISGVSFGYLFSVTQYFTLSLDSTFSYATINANDLPFKSRFTISGIGGGVRTGVFLHEKLYAWLGFSMQPLLFTESAKNGSISVGNYGPDYHGGISIHPQVGFNILFIRDFSIFANVGYEVFWLFNVDRMKNPNKTVALSVGATYNAF